MTTTLYNYDVRNNVFYFLHKYIISAVINRVTQKQPRRTNTYLRPLRNSNTLHFYADNTINTVVAIINCCTCIPLLLLLYSTIAIALKSV